MSGRRILAVVIVVTVGYFFAREMRGNWQALSVERFTTRWEYLGVAAILACASYLAATLSWLDAMRAVSGVRLSFDEAFALFNSSQLLKYVPGKVWGWGLQAYCAAGHGITMAQVVSVNALMTVSTLAIAAISGFAYLFLETVVWPAALTGALLALACCAYLLLVLGGVRSANFAFTALGKILGKDFPAIAIPPGTMIRLQALYVTSMVLFGLAGYAVALAMGPLANGSHLLAIAASLLFSDAIAFVALVTPGGLGIREMAMYALLNETMDMRTALILPLAVRAVTMAVDLLMGGVALWQLRNFMKREAHAPTT